jgi:hypothetical protein
MLLRQLDGIVTEFISQLLIKTILMNINTPQDSTFYVIICTLNDVDLKNSRKSCILVNRSVVPMKLHST